MPELQSHQATTAVGMSVFPPLAHIGLARLKCGGSARVLLMRSSTIGTPTPLVWRPRKAPRSVPCRSYSLTKPQQQLE